MQGYALTPEEKAKAAALEAIRQARLKAMKADRQGALDDARELYSMPAMNVAAQGAMQGLSHGFADDIERMSADAARGETFDDKYFHNTGERVATNQVLAKASDPILYNLAMLGGAGAAGLATRGVFKGAGGLLKQGANMKRARAIDDALVHNRSDEARARAIGVAEDAFRKSARTADRVGNAGLPSNRAQALTFDTAHGALMGYGGLDPAAEEEALSVERAARAGAGGALGFMFAPTVAGGANFAGQASKYAQQQAGMMPRTPLRRAKLREDVTPDEALLRTIGMDEHVARRTREGGAGMMQGSEPNPLITATGQHTRGIVDHAITAPAGRDLVEASMDGMPTQTQTQRISRMADAPGGGDAAMQMARRIQDEAGGDSRKLLEREAAAPAPAPKTAAQQKWLDGLMQAFEAGDSAVAADWGRRFGQQKGVQQAVRTRMFETLLREFDLGGFDGLAAMINDPKRRPFFEAAGLGKQLDSILGARDQNSRYQAVNRLMAALDGAVARDAGKKPPAPKYANRQDQKIARYRMDDPDAAAITTAALPGRTFDMPGYVPPIDPATSGPMLTATNAPFSAYMREAAGSTKRKLFGGEDFSTADVTAGGAAATMLAALAEDQAIGPLIKQLKAMGMPDEQILQVVVPQPGMRPGLPPGMAPPP